MNVAAGLYRLAYKPLSNPQWATFAATFIQAYTAQSHTAKKRAVRIDK